MKKKLDFNQFKLILFDFDGVIVDTELIHYAAFNKILFSYGIKISKKEYFEKYLAYDDKGCFKKVFREKLKTIFSNKKILSLVKEKNKILLSQLNKGFKVYPDSIKFINFLSSVYPEIKLGIVSGAMRNEITFILDKLSLKDKFLFIISSEDVKNGKPSPEPFIKAKKVAEKLTCEKFSSKEILIVEDSINGIISGKKVNFKTLAVSHTYPVSQLRKVSPDYITTKLTDLIERRE